MFCGNSMIHKKIGFFLTALFLLNSLSAEVIGNLKFTPPVSLKGWDAGEPNKDEEGSFKIYMQNYEHELDNFKESLYLMNLYSVEIPVFKKGFSKETDIKDYLTNKYQKIFEKTCAEDGSYSNPRVLVSNIIENSESIFYQVTMFDGPKMIGCIWGREIKREGQWIQFSYGLMEKYPRDPNFLAEDIEKTASSWIQFLKDDFFEKVVYLNY